MAWFQYQLQSLAKHLVKDRPFSIVVDRLPAEFPAANQKEELLDRLVHLDAIQAGANAVLGLACPAALPFHELSECPSPQ